MHARQAATWMSGIPNPVKTLHLSVIPATIPEVRSLMVEHLVRDEGVAGSNPATPTNKIKHF
jgi:hypothetical protein